MEEARVRVTMGCLDDESCPARLKSLELRDWSLPDPAALDDEGFRQVRDRIRGRFGDCGRNSPSGTGGPRTWL